MKLGYSIRKGRNAAGEIRWRAYVLGSLVTHSWDTPGDLGPCEHRFACVTRVHAKAVARKNTQAWVGETP